MTTLYCGLCAAQYWVSGEIAPVCPTCHRRTRWTTTPTLVNFPPLGSGMAGAIRQWLAGPIHQSGWTLTADDARFLRQLHIRPEA
jgi:hypothetical protein